MMTEISREYHFSAAHRLEGHIMCGRLHGHNYQVRVALEGHLTEEGWIMDFGILDRIVSPLIGELDHRYLVSESNLAMSDPYAALARDADHDYVLPIKASTAECLAAWLAKEVWEAVKLTATNVEYVTVTVRETAKSEATVTSS